MPRPTSISASRGAAVALVALLAVLETPAAADALGGGSATVERGLLLMGTRATLRVEAVDRTAALKASEAAVRALEAAELRLSTWSSDDSRAPGELARLNRAPVGEPVALSPELADELRRAEACRRATDGAFDPGIGALVAAWGLRSDGRIPEAAEVDAARAVGGEALELRDDGTAVRRSEGLRLEEGGFGKGAGLDAALAVLEEDPAVLAAEIDLGGQVAVLRRAGAGPAVPATVELAHPEERGRTVARLGVAGGSVATSGNAERGLTVGGRELGHLLDPRTGRPAPDFGSLTVWAPGALEADCLATGLYVLGPERALAWAETHAGIEAAVARVAGAAAGGAVEITITSGLTGRIAALDGAATIEALDREPEDSTPADAGMKAGAGAGNSVPSEVPGPHSPKDRGSRVTAPPHEPGADGNPRP